MTLNKFKKDHEELYYLLKIELKFELVEFKDVESFKRELNGSVIERSSLIHNFKTHLEKDQIALVEVHKKIQKMLSDWKGDFEDELNLWADGNEKQKVYEGYSKILEIERKILNSIDGVEVNFEQAKSILFGNYSEKRFKESLGIIFEGIRTKLEILLEDEKKVHECIKSFNDLVRELELKGHKLKDYKRMLDANQEKLLDLLLGKNYYARYTQEQRRDLWNRWVGSSSKKVLVDIEFPYETNLSGFNFNNFVFKNVSFRGTILVGASFHLAFIEDIDFSYSNIRRASFVQANASDANFGQAHSEKGYPINGADFRHARLDGANFEHAYLVNVHFNNASLVGGNFTYASLIKAIFVESNVKNAKFEGADLKETLFRGVINLTKTQLKSSPNWKLALEVPKGI